MASEEHIPSIEPVEPGVVLGSVEPQHRRGDRASRIRYLHDKYPDMSNCAIARRVDCSEANVRGVLRAYLRDIPVSDLDEFRTDKPSIFEAIQHRTLRSITNKDIANSSFSQRIVAAAILQDKIQVLRGQPTSIHVTALVNVLDAIAELREQRDE